MVLMNIAYIENPDLFHILETLPGGSQEIIFDNPIIFEKETKG